MKKNRWLFYTVGVAALPIIIRLVVVVLMIKHNWSSLLTPIDFVFFSLTLNLSNINELNILRVKRKKNTILDENVKEELMNWSIFAIVILGIILGFSYIPIKIFNCYTLLISAIFLAVVSFFHSKNIINKINSLEDENN